MCQQNSAASLEVIRKRLLHLWCAADIVPSAASPEILRAAGALDSNVEGIIAAQVWDPSHPCHGSTNGCKERIGPEKAGITWYTGGPMALATALACPLSRHYNSPEVLERLEASLRYIEPCLRPETPKHGSWYLWDIGWPAALAQILIVAGGRLDAALRRSLEEALLGLPALVYKVDRERGVTYPIQGGANMMCVLQGLLLRGVALGDARWIASAAEQVPVVISVVDGQGLQADWSFHFHGRGVNAGYGCECLLMQSRWIYLTSGTPWACREAELQLHLGMIREFFRFNVWKGRVSPYSVDRGIASPGGIYGAVMRQIALMGLASGFGEGDREMLAGFALDLMDPFGQGSCAPSLENALLEEQTRPLQEPARMAEGLRYYPSSEYLLSRRPGWYCAVRMASVRTKTWNAQNGQHIHGSSGAECSIALMTDGREFDHTTIPTMDWGRLMGVTCCRAIETPPEGYGQSAFVGGVADDTMAALGMQYLLAPPGQGVLRANKSVFVTPDALILLGDKVRCDALGEPVETTLFHAPLEDGAVYRLNGAPLDVSADGERPLAPGDFLLLRNVAIRLLNPATLVVVTREGCYNDLNDPHIAKVGAFAQKHVRRWVYVIANHGVRPYEGAYGAILWPGVAADFTPGGSCWTVERTADVHRVIGVDGQIGGEVRFPSDFRKPGGLSYYGAEPFKWGSIARWKPAPDDPQRFDVTILPPQRFLRDAQNAHTEIFLPEGFEAENVTLVSMTGQPFPPHLLAIKADGNPRVLRVRKKCARQ